MLSVADAGAAVTAPQATDRSGGSGRGQLRDLHFQLLFAEQGRCQR